MLIKIFYLTLYFLLKFNLADRHKMESSIYKLKIDITITPVQVLLTEPIPL